MPELIFKGKEFVFNHHLTVPHRPLVPDSDKSVGELRQDGNLIIHGDNLHALKSLLPMYAGKVDCVFIDPPYNTGNEGWCYNDNVNSPMMQAWLSENPVGIEDGLRHDKWCAMMWPRFRLLHELLSESGSIWITLDDNELHRARMILDEIFGEENFIDTIAWQKIYTVKNSARHFSEMHDYIIVYGKDQNQWGRNLIGRTEEQEEDYSNPDSDPRGPWTTNAVQARNYYSLGQYEIKSKTGKVFTPPKGTYWRVSKESFEELDVDGRVWWGSNGTSIPRIKKFLSEAKEGVVPATLWFHRDAGTNAGAKQELRNIFSESDDELFITPKPVKLISKILEIASTPQSLVLDSFAGSATTAHAVLAKNAKDGGNRRFIMVECEDYADRLSAERVRRVIDGYRYQGVQKEELLRENITWTNFSKDKAHQKLLEKVQSYENLDAARFDVIKRSIKDGELIVSGENNIEEQVEGLGGSFTFCTLGEAIDMDRMLTGAALPSYEALGTLLFHTATNESLSTPPVSPSESEGIPNCGYLGESAAFHVWLIYRPDLDFLKSREAALTLAKAKAIAEDKLEKRHLVFAPAKFVSQKLLDHHKIPVEFAPLPWALYRMGTG